MAKTGSSPRTELILAGERLIAVHGIDVALRDIAAEAHQRNNSAVHYYFGSRDGLITAIVDFHVPTLEAHRLEMLADLAVEPDPPDLKTLIELNVRPLFTVPYQNGSTHYARCMERIRSFPLLANIFRDRDLPASRRIYRWLYQTLPADLGKEERLFRIEAMGSALFAMLADYERRRAQHPESCSHIEDNIIAMNVGMLAQPVRSTPASRNI